MSTAQQPDEAATGATATGRPQSVIHDLGYRGYDGPRAGRGGVLEDLDDDESRELMSYTQHLIRVVKAVSAPDSFNVGLNLGGAAGGLLSAWLINDKRSRRRF